jgi:uncharacterized membrane protein YdjX (TVP38/TMEM64 family)
MSHDSSHCKMSGRQAGPPPDVARDTLWRWLPLIAIVSATGLVFALGWHRYLSLKTIGLNYETLANFIASHRARAIAIYALVYVAAVTLSLPGALILTVTGGLLFGWEIALPIAVVAATTGATIFFVVARTSLGQCLAGRASVAVDCLRAGFQKDALSYMLFLRLVPVFPFVVINLAAALLGVPLGPYILGTFLGIIPGTAAYAVAGSGLASVIEAQNASYRACLERSGADTCAYTIDTSALVTKELVCAFALLGIVALIPVALKKWKARNAAV